MRATSATVWFFLGIAVVLGFLGQSKLLGDPDTFWHIAVGRRILAERTLPTVDEFTYTAHGQPWLANQWLAECTLAIVDRYAGCDGILCGAVTLVSALLAWIASRYLRSGAHWLVAVMAVTLVFGASAYNLVARPHLTTMVFLPLVFAWLMDVDAGRRSLHSLVGLPLLVVLWANLHGGVLGGVATLSLTATAWIGGRWMGWTSPVRTGRDVVWLVGIVVGSCGALWVNPYGGAMFTAWRRILAMDLPHLVIEHARLDPRRPEGLLVVLLAMLYVACLARANRAQMRVTWWIPLVWLCLAVSRIRHAPLFASLAAISLVDIIPTTTWAASLARRELWRLLPPSRPRRVVWGVALVCVPLLIFALACQLLDRRRTASESGAWARPLARIWPSELREDLDLLPTSAEHPLRVFNDQLYGGFLIYHYPERRVFIDGRCELFGEERLRDYLAAQSDPAIIERWLARFPSDAAVVRADSAFDRYFGELAAWHLVRRSRQSCLYVHRERLVSGGGTERILDE